MIGGSTFAQADQRQSAITWQVHENKQGTTLMRRLERLLKASRRVARNTSSSLGVFYRGHRQAIRRTGAAVALAVLAAAITTDRVDSAAEWIGDTISKPFSSTDRPPPEFENIANEYFEQTREATIWDSHPILYPPSEQYYRRHFADYDPRRRHPFDPVRPVVSPAELVSNAPLLVGGAITVLGKVRVLQVLTPLKFPNVEYVAQLGQAGNPNARTPLVYCRFAERDVHRLPEDRWAAVVGIPLALGNVPTNDGGATQAAYLAGTAARPVPGGPKAFFAHYFAGEKK